MEIFIMIPPCIRCLITCPKCSHLDKPRRESQAQAALDILRLLFPDLVPPEPPENEKEDETL